MPSRLFKSLPGEPGGRGMFWRVCSCSVCLLDRENLPMNRLTRWCTWPAALVAVAAASSFLLPGLNTLVALAALQVIQALSGAASSPALQSLVADLTGDDRRGRAYGIYALAGGLGATVGPLVGGWLYESVSPAAPFYANGIVLAISTLVLWALLKVPPAPEMAQQGGQP